MDAQVLGEEGAHHHAHAIVHIPGGPKLAHSGVDKRNARSAGLPVFEPRVIPGPVEAVEFLPHVLGGEIGQVVEAVPGKVAPQQLGVKLGGLWLLGRGEPHLARGDLAKAQVGREQRGGIERGDIALFGVVGQVQLG